GGVAGAVIGSQIGGGNGKKVMTVLGALGGAMAGKHIEKQARGTTRWEVDVRHDNGVQETVLSDVAPPYGAGDRVRVVDGRLQPPRSAARSGQRAPRRWRAAAGASAFP
ncbi:MAG TPA: glycine zipper 2TM domain-containing protein, partial [Burkholderiales bacterium]